MIKNSTRLILFSRQLWTPANIFGGLALWLDAADASTIVLNGSTVSQWRDKSGNNRHASSNTPSSSPAYVLNGLNRLNIIQSTFKRMDSPFVNTNKLTYFVVYRRRSSPSNTFSNIAFVVDIGTINAPNDTGRLSQLIYEDPFKFGATMRVSTDIKYSRNDNWNIHEVVCNVGSNLTYRINGTNIETRIDNNSSITGSPVFRIGDGHTWNDVAPSSSTIQSDIDIAEIIAVLDTNELPQVQGYLAHKWGLAANLPNNHPFKFTAPRT